MDFYLILDYVKIAVEILFAFGVVIFFHELGHFALAKWNGVKVTDFALGMGPELFGVDYKGTRYKFCAFPIGGYVCMVGEEDDEELEASVPKENNFRYKNPLQKISIIFAGPFMNVILAILLFASIFVIWGQPRELPVSQDNISQSVVVSFSDPRMPAAKAGIRTDDVIYAIDGEKMAGIQSVEDYIIARPGQKMNVTVIRDGEKKDIEVTPKKKKEPRAKIGARLLDGQQIEKLNNEKRIVIDSVFKDQAADQAGLAEGDVVLSLDDNNITSSKKMVDYIGKHADQAVNFKILRGEEELEIAVTPTSTEWGEIGVMLGFPVPRMVESVAQGSSAEVAGLKKGDVILDFNGASFHDSEYKLPLTENTLLVYRENGETESITVKGEKGAVLGAKLLPTVQRLDPFTAIWQGTKYTGIMVVRVVDALSGMITRRVSADGVGGPVAIVQYASSFARQGLKDLIAFFGGISITLGLINLFPFPALDGSRIVFHIWEAIRRKPLDPAREGMIHYVGFCILMALIVFITYRDIRMWLGF
jgi:regulator of sigma E protease